MSAQIVFWIGVAVLTSAILVAAWKTGAGYRCVRCGRTNIPRGVCAWCSRLSDVNGIPMDGP